MMELLHMSFFVNALVMGILVAMIYGILSFFVVTRKMSFLGAGISHSAFGGVALGVFLGIDPFVTSLFFCVTVALLMGKLVRYGKISYDTSIGIFFSFSMAMGALLIALKKEYTFDLMGYLFGNILGITFTDNIITIAVILIFVPFVALFFFRILFLAFDEEVAAVSGVRTGVLDTVLLVFLASIIVVSIKIIGIILVSALVVLPASFGMLLSRDFRIVISGGVLYAVFVMTGGLVLSYYIDTPAGATVVTLATLMYFSGAVVKKTINRDR